MIESTSDKNLKNKELIRSDLNLEKWSLFATRGNRGMRVLRREKLLPGERKIAQQVTIGLKGSKEVLTTEEGKLFYLFVDMWEKRGRNPNGLIYSSINKILNDLISRKEGTKPKNVRRGGWSKKWLMEKIKKMLSVPIVYESAYENKDGTIRSIESFTLLSKADVFDRKISPNQSYFDFSSFVIHPVIVKSILEKHVKPIRLDVIVELKMEISVVLYRFLDLVMADKVQFERDIIKLAESLGFPASRRDNLIRKLRDCCVELEGKDLTTGRIGYCRVEEMANKNGWKLVVKKVRQTAALTKKNDKAPAVVGTSEVSDDELWLSLYEKMSEEKRKAVNADAIKIYELKYAGYGGEFTRHMALLDAIKALPVEDNSSEVDDILDPEPAAGKNV